MMSTTNNNYASDFSDDDTSPWEDTESSSFYGDEEMVDEDELIEEDDRELQLPSYKNPRIDMIRLEMEKECEQARVLKVLPRPVFRCSWRPDEVVETATVEEGDDALETQSCSSTASSASASPKPIISPWKKIEPTTTDEDPWKFLEPATPPSSPRRHPYPRSSYHDRHAGRDHHDRNRHDRGPRNQHGQGGCGNNNHHRNHHGGGGDHHHENTRIDNSDTNKLCKYKKDCRMNERGNCSMVHDLSEWKPRICRFDTRCKRKNQCGYYHHDVPIHIYLSQMIKRKESVYHKNAALYSKYLHH